VDRTVGGQALLDANAFLYVAGAPARQIGHWPNVRVTWATPDESSSTTLHAAPGRQQVEPAALPGPDRVERTIEDGSIAWLERREPRGEPFEWPADRVQRVVHARSLRPDPERTFRVAVALTGGTQWFTQGRWYCIAWLWPLVSGEASNMCTRASELEHGLMYTSQWNSSVSQFALWIGIAADEVERLELVFPDHTVVEVPVADNTFAFQTRRDEPTKLVGYDAEGRVVTVEIVGARGSSLRGIAIAP
jgi:hypothetical protein